MSRRPTPSATPCARPASTPSGRRSMATTPGPFSKRPRSEERRVGKEWSAGRHTRFSRDWSSDVCSSDLDAAAMLERADVAKLNANLKDELVSKGMVYNEPKADAFRDALRKAGFYAEWKKKYGDDAWAILEKA